MSKNIISKKKFCEMIQAMQEREQYICELNAVFHKYDDDNSIIGSAPVNRMEDLIVEILEFIMEDKGHWISWYCFESDFGEFGNMQVVTEDDQVYNLDSPEKLYDFLLEN